MNKCFLKCLVLCFFFQKIECEGPIAHITNGYILGRESITPNGKSLFMFQGVPYAQPPLGNLRLADPQEHENWNDVKDCTNRNIVCLQISKETTEFETEDCLILNVYTPKFDVKESNLPVMVYFHGGGFYMGNTSYNSYGPEFFMDRDVVVVVVNYRLGAFGFLSTEDDVITGNFGLKDQQLAIKWVHKNIRAFNGDPEKVTIFGESAGSASVGYQLLNKKNQGLFRGAIMSSGSPLGSWAFQRNPKKVAYLTAKFINNSEIINSSQELVRFLRSVPALDLKKASYNLKHTDPFGYRQWLDGYYYSPSVEYNTSNAFLVSHPYELLENGNFVHVPLITGINSEEQLYMIEDGDAFVNVLKSYDAHHELMVSAHLSIDDVEQRKEVGKRIHGIYCDGNEKLEDHLNKGIRFFSDQKINFGILRQAYFTANFADVYLYQFSYHGLMGNNKHHVEGAGESRMLKTTIIFGDVTFLMQITLI
ncbi:hypothetical protein WA026_013217 [Henosepilachna vigintioctopunctata]|uniref:Carboxylesterase type B domain-containing protein n=1 Tax=Henosepilachna vigintioctopunctata TaxID=420089 RepID=A0AAW1UIF5_9CUCU